MYQEDASNHVNSSAESISSIRQRFPIFKFQMMNGFNLLLHGFGSKKEILEDFATNFLNDAPKCVVNGYFPSLTIRQLLSTIRKDILMLTTSSRNLDQSVDEILSKMTYSRRFYLVINNIDGVALQDFYSQRILSLLAENPYISVIASIDNVHSQIRNRKLILFLFVSKNVSNFCF